MTSEIEMNRNQQLNQLVGFGKFMQTVNGWSDREYTEAARKLLKLEEKESERSVLDNFYIAFQSHQGLLVAYLNKDDPQKHAKKRPRLPQLDKSENGPSKGFNRLNGMVIKRDDVSPSVMKAFLFAKREEAVKDPDFDATDVASAMGFHEITYDKLLSGGNEFVQAGTIRKVCEYYGTTPHEINKKFGDADALVKKQSKEKKTKRKSKQANLNQDWASYAIDIAGFGAFICQTREEKNISTEKLADIIGHSEVVVDAHEMGRVAKVFPPFLKQFCEGMNIKPETIEAFCANRVTLKKGEGYNPPKPT